MRLPYAEVEFETTGRLHEPAQQQAALGLVRSERATDVLVLVHGWNNDMSAARGLFERLTARVADAVDLVPAAAQRRIVVLGVLWPSIRWASEDQLAGGGAGLVDEQSALQAEIAERIEDPQAMARLEQLVPDLETSADARREFLDILRGQVPELPDDEEPPPTAFLQGDAQDVFEQASEPETEFGGAERAGGAANVAGGPATVEEPGTAGGGAAGFGFGSLLGGARALLNLTTYYTMKQRAGTVGSVGSSGVAQLLAAVDQVTSQPRLHLVGHSFGARVVVAAAAQHPSLHSVILLQGAFSHHGLAADYDGKGNDGFFRQILAPTPRLAGPLLITHTDNDKAVGLAYAIASRLARQQASGLGGPDDLYGGIGRNGALRTPEVTQPPGQLLDVGDTYDLKAGHVHNLKADTHISSHSDVTGPQVGYAVLSAMVS